MAVSGGVDSVSMLDILAKHGEGLDLAVAHFDHGWADHPETDARSAVAGYAKVLRLPFYVGDSANVPASEEYGRQQRYDYLFGLAAALGAKGVITAHHADDKLETSLFNVSRGTSRRGRSPEFDRPGIWRPLIGLTKSDLETYAAEQELPVWQDSADSDMRFSRNFFRREVIPTAEQMHPGFIWLYRELMDSTGQVSGLIENEITKLLDQIAVPVAGGIELDRTELSHLPLPVIAEVIMSAIRQIEPGLQLRRERVKQLALAVKAGRPGITKDIAGRLKLRVGYDRVAVVLPLPEGAANL